MVKADVDTIWVRIRVATRVREWAVQEVMEEAVEELDWQEVQESRGEREAGEMMMKIEIS